MKAFIIALALLGVLAAETGHWGIEEQDDVAVLTKDNFNDFVKKHKYVFVKFYAPWCGHCKTMAPAYSKLAKRTKGEANGVPIAKVDATVESELGERFGVKGFPTLKLFIDGEPVDYSGAREEDAIYSWLQKKSGPASKELTSLDDVKQLEGGKLNVLLVTSADNAGQLAKLNTVANGFDDIAFHYTTSQEVKDYLGTGNKNAFYVFRNFDEGTQKLTDTEDLTADAMKEFLTTHRFPSVMPFEQEAAERIFGSETPAIFLFNEGTESPATKAFAAVAKTRKGDILFSQSTITSGLGARLAEFLGVTDKDANTVRIVRFGGGNLTKYKLTDVTEEGINKFIDDWKANKLTAYYKSEPVPENEKAGSVKTIVGNNFEDVVLNSDKHVLLEAYAPWCGHCKKLEPIYDELAAKLAGDSDIIIAKIDATANEHSSLNVKGFPTIKFYKKGAKDAPIDFNGDRTVEGFTSFLSKEVGRELGTGTAAGDSATVETGDL